ncbi:MAG: diaminopimelate epimerase [Acidimicrobiia bacterium]|nr:diaminopimelate epimerase [Acidimicrobiia bacterium]
MQLSMHHGLRNDFLVVLDDRNSTEVTAGPDMARQLCDRRSGLGADGLIHGARPAPGSDADVVMHLWNADGSRAEMSGNGIRCLAQAVARSKGLADGVVAIDTDTGRREVSISRGPSRHKVVASVDLGVVGPGPGVAGSELPIEVKEVATADLGNPHLVAWVDGDLLADIALGEVGPAIEAIYADGINVELIAPGPDPDSLVLRVWERGAGITQACGTGACAAASLARRWGMVGSTVTVHMPGGSVVVDLVDDRAILSGPAVHVADIEIDEAVVLGG